MKTNNIDIKIKEKLQNRSIQPSASAWERLSTKLDEQPKKQKKGWVYFIGIAASILLLVSIGIQLFSTMDVKVIPKQQIVVQPIDTIFINKKIEDVFNEIPIEEAIVYKDKVEVEKIKKVKKNKEIILTNDKSSLLKEEQPIIANIDNNKFKNVSENTINNSKETNKSNPNTSIKVNSEDLLFAVTHSPSEVKVYYAKYNINRDDVLKTIQNHLKKSNLKIDPNIILAEVEQNINEEDFENNFLKSLKKHVRNISTVIASRND